MVELLVSIRSWYQNAILVMKIALPYQSSYITATNPISVVGPVLRLWII